MAKLSLPPPSLPSSLPLSLSGHDYDLTEKKWHVWFMLVKNLSLGHKHYLTEGELGPSEL